MPVCVCIGVRATSARMLCMPACSVSAASRGWAASCASALPTKLRPSPSRRSDLLIMANEIM